MFERAIRCIEFVLQNTHAPHDKHTVTDICHQIWTRSRQPKIVTGRNIDGTGHYDGSAWLEKRPHRSG